MRFTQAEIRAGLRAAGAESSDDLRRPREAEILAAVAMAASPDAEPGYAAFPVTGDAVTCFRIVTRDRDTGRGVPRDRLWVTSGLQPACTAALALTWMNGRRMWPAYVSGAYKAFLPGACQARVIRPVDGEPYQEITTLRDVPLHDHLRLLGWIAPSRVQMDEVARRNGFGAYTDIPAGTALRVPLQREVAGIW